MKRLAMAVGGVGFWIAAASTGDLGPQSHAPPGKSEAGYYNWTGLYAGAFVGEAHSIWTIDFYRNDNHGHAEVASDGIAGGAWIGYNWQMSRHLVFGIEADLGWTNARQNNRVFANDHTDSSIGMFGSVRGRAGYAIDRLLLFATAGVAFADVSQNIQKGRNAGEQVV